MILNEKILLNLLTERQMAIAAGNTERMEWLDIEIARVRELIEGRNK